MYKWLIGVIFTLLASNSVAQSWQASSTEKMLAVLEIFTAEGCGNCPAADRWVAALPEQGIDTDNVMVLAFHVDYLDDKKGWVDRFATPLFSDRQKQLARLNLYQTVYTPEIFISGELVHNWQDHGVEVINFINDFDAEASISLAVEKRADKLEINSTVRVDGDDNRQQAKLYLALVENNLTSRITGGDNAGMLAHHQHIVRQWLGPFELDKTGVTRLTTQLNLDKAWKAEDLMLAAVVQNLSDGYVLQGLSLPLSD